jgi:hypothetical protein
MSSPRQTAGRRSRTTRVERHFYMSMPWSTIHMMVSRCKEGRRSAKCRVLGQEVEQEGQMKQEEEEEVEVWRRWEGREGTADCTD